MSQQVTRWLIDLGDRKELTRTRAVKEIVRSGREDLSYVLRRVSSRDKAPGVRYLARKGLELLSRKHRSRKAGKADKASDIDTVMSSIDSDNPEVRTFMALEAMRFSDARLIPYLAQRLRVEDDVYVVATLVKALGVLGARKEIDTVVPYLNHDDSRVRANALEALNILASKGFADEIKPMISRQLNDPDHRVRINAIKALTQGRELDIPDLLEEMLKAREVWVRDSAIHAICSIGGEAMRYLLEMAAMDPVKHIRAKAEKALLELNHIQTLKTGEAPSGEEKKYRPERAAASAVQSAATPGDTARPRRRADTASPVKPASSPGIPASGRKGVYQLISQLDSREPDDRKKAVIALGRMADKRAFKHLMRMLDDESKVVRYFAHRAIEQLEKSTKGLVVCPSCGFSFKNPEDSSFDSPSASSEHGEVR